MAQWANFGRHKSAFQLYVPASTVEITRRLMTENQVHVAELWSYHTVGDQTRFTLVERASGAKTTQEPRTRRASAPVVRNGRQAARPARKAPSSARTKRPAARATPKTSSAKQKRK
jgi:hypothetical protein